MKRKKTIMVVDDDPVNFRFLQCLEVDFTVRGVPSGFRALEILSSGPCDLLIISRCLPDLDGLTMLNQVRQHHPSVPIIFMAAAPDNDLILSVFRSGAQDFLTLPLNADEMVKSVRRIFEPAFPLSSDGGLSSVKTTMEIEDGALPGGSGDTPASQNTKQTGFRDSKGLRYLVKRLFSKILQMTTITSDVKVNPPKVPGALEGGHVSPDLPRREATQTFKSPFAPVTVEKDVAQPPVLKVFFFGKFRIIIGDRLIEEWPTHKAKEILAFLLYHRQRPVYRDILMDKFWPNSSLDSARNCLNVTLHGIRTLLQKLDSTIEFIVFKDECYSINPDLEVQADVEDFSQHWRRGRALERERNLELALPEYELAVSLYRGDFMEEDLYESWNEPDRENYKETYLTILDKLSHYYSMNGKPEVAIDLCQQILERDNCREDIYRRLMKSYCRLGKREKALREFQRCEQVLQKEFQVTPTPQTLKLLEQIKQI